MADEPLPPTPPPGPFSPTPHFLQPRAGGPAQSAESGAALALTAAEVRRLKAKLRQLLDALDGGANKTMLVKTAGTDFAFAWVHSPAGGATAGNVLTKVSGADYDYDWKPGSEIKADVGTITVGDMAAALYGEDGTGMTEGAFFDLYGADGTGETSGLMFDLYGTGGIKANACGLLAALNSATINAVCNDDGTLTVTLSMPDLPATCPPPPPPP